MIAPEIAPSIIGVLFGAFWLWLCKYARKQPPPARLIECPRCEGLYTTSFERCPACNQELKP
jgi:hypothetical protein